LAFEPGRKVCRPCTSIRRAAYKAAHPGLCREQSSRSYRRIYHEGAQALGLGSRSREIGGSADNRAKRTAQAKRWYAGLSAEERRAVNAPKAARIAALRTAARAARPPKPPKPAKPPRVLLTDAERAVRRRLKNQRKWAKRKGAAGKVTPADIDFLENAQRGRCFYCCGKFGASGYQIDHFEPLARGGSNHRSNLRLACAPCNLAKSDRPAAEFMAMLIL
jgi:5-methylcytosine-specific restriction endonuclease McrA